MRVVMLLVGWSRFLVSWLFSSLVRGLRFGLGGVGRTPSDWRISARTRAISGCDGRPVGAREARPPTRARSGPRPGRRRRSASASASSTSWVTSRIAIECRRQSSITSWCISIRVSASSALNGSSSSSSAGLLTSARASETRWACPPDSCSGQASSLSVRPTSSSVCSGQLVAVAALGAVEQRQRDVLLHPAPRQQPRLLERDGRAAGDLDLARGDRVEVRQAAQQRRLAAAAAPEQGDELAGPDVEVDRCGAPGCPRRTRLWPRHPGDDRRTCSVGAVGGVGGHDSPCEGLPFDVADDGVGARGRAGCRRPGRRRSRRSGGTPWRG